MYLRILDYRYIQSSSHLVQGVSNHRVPRRAVAGGNGSFIVANPAQIMVDLIDDATGEQRTVDMYSGFKDLIDGKRLTKKRAEAIIDLYKRHGPFLAEGWNDWYPTPGLESVID